MAKLFAGLDSRFRGNDGAREAGMAGAKGNAARDSGLVSDGWELAARHGLDARDTPILAFPHQGLTALHFSGGV